MLWSDEKRRERMQYFVNQLGWLGYKFSSTESALNKMVQAQQICLRFNAYKFNIYGDFVGHVHEGKLQREKSFLLTFL